MSRWNLGWKHPEISQILQTLIPRPGSRQLRHLLPSDSTRTSTCIPDQYSEIDHCWLVFEWH